MDALRGLAALAVCWFHLIGQIELPPGLLLQLGQMGHLGVEVFFVISGFVIPFSLARSKYTPNLYFRFLARRLMRLDPPYLISIILFLLLGFAKAWFVRSVEGRLPLESPEQLISHLAYATELVGHKWISPAYWTLAIEFQFYLLLGLIFPLVMHELRLVRYGMLLLFLFGPLLPLPQAGTILKFLPWFSFGILACHYRRGQASTVEFLAGVVLITAFLSIQFQPGGIIALTSTCLVVGFWHGGCGRHLAWLGEVSYSLYLTHGVFGVGFLVVGKALHLPGWANYPLVLGATAFSIIMAAWFHRLIETPAQRWAGRFPIRSGFRS